MAGAGDRTARVTVRYWAGARAAAGVSDDVVAAQTVGAALDAVLQRRPQLEPVLRVATLLLDGRAVDRDAVVADRSVVEVLPPFAGG